jgi:hypothetical protein
MSHEDKNESHNGDELTTLDEGDDGDNNSDIEMNGGAPTENDASSFCLEINNDDSGEAQELYTSMRAGTNLFVPACIDLSNGFSHTDIENAAENPAISLSDRDNADHGEFNLNETVHRCNDLIAKITKDVVTPTTRKKDTPIPSNDTTAAAAAAAAAVSLERSQEEIVSRQVEEVVTFVRRHLPRALVSAEDVQNIARSMVSRLASDDRESLSVNERISRSVVDNRILLPRTPELEPFIQRCTESNQLSRINDSKEKEKRQYTRTSNIRSDKSSDKKGNPNRKTHCCSFCGQKKVTITKNGLRIPHGTCPKVMGTDVGGPGDNDIDDTLEKNPKRYKVLYPRHPNKVEEKDCSGDGDGDDGFGQKSTTREALDFLREQIDREEMEDGESTKAQTRSSKRKSDNTNEEIYLDAEEVLQVRERKIIVSICGCFLYVPFDLLFLYNSYRGLSIPRR